MNFGYFPTSGIDYLCFRLGLTLIHREILAVRSIMGSYVSVENDINDAREVRMKYCAWHGRGFNNQGFNVVENGHRYKSNKLSLSLICQINIVVVKEENGKPQCYRGQMTTWSGSLNGTTRRYRASDAPLQRF